MKRMTRMKRMKRMKLKTLADVLALFDLPEDQIVTAVHHGGDYVTAMLAPRGDQASGAFVIVDVEPGASPFEPPRWVVVSAHSDDLEAAAERSLRLHTDPKTWSPAESIPTLLLSLLADLNAT